MVKKLIVLVVVLVMCLAGCTNNSDMSGWAFGDNDAIGARVGIEVIDPNIEVGVSGLWLPDIEKPVAYGLYAVYHGPEVLEVPNPLTFFSERISGHPYGGGKFDVDARFEEGMLSPIVGFIFAGDDESGISAFIEYQPESFDRTQIGESKIMIGGRYEF